MVTKNYRTVTVIEATAILISTIIGVGVLALPRLAAKADNSGAPLITVLGILVAFWGLSFITVLGMRFPNESIIEYGERILGKWLARIGSGLIIVFFIVLTGLGAREFSKVLVTSVLTNTPITVVTVVMIVLAALASRANMSTFAYSHLFYLPFVYFPGLVIDILSTKNGSLLNLQPIIGNEPQFMPIVSGSLTVAGLFQGAFVMSFVIPAMRRPEKAMTASAWGLPVAGLLYLLLVIATVAVFGPQATKLFVWPTLELAKTTMLPGEVLERLDAPFLILWVTAVFTTLYSTYSIIVRALKELFHLRDHRMFAPFVLPFVFFAAMLPPNVIQLYRVIELVSRTGLWITFVYPMMLLCVALIRKQKDGNRVAS